MNNRIDKVNRLLKKEIAYVLQNELKDNIGMVSIVGVKTSRDLSVSHVYYSVLGNDRQKEKVQGILENATGFIRKMVAARVRLKFFPALDFILDDSIEHSFHMDEVFKRIHEEDQRHHQEKQ